MGDYAYGQWHLGARAHGRTPRATVNTTAVLGPLPPLRDPWASARDPKHSSRGEKGRLPADLLPPGLRPKEGKRVGGHFSELVKKESYTDFFFFF